jgi:hypothetical protein
MLQERREKREERRGRERRRKVFVNERKECFAGGRGGGAITRH